MAADLVAIGGMAADLVAIGGTTVDRIAAHWLADLPWLPGGAVCATDLWSGAAVPGSFSSGAFSAVVPPHDAGAFRLAAC